mgnify:CR=1 FL=1
MGVFVNVKPAKSANRGARNPNDPFYWSFLEFGTSKMAARPFMRPAFDTKKFVALKTIEGRMRREVAAETAKLAARRRSA